MANDTKNARILLPTGRLVGGDPYTAQEVKDDKTGQIKLIKSGQNMGGAVTSCYTPIAIKKGSESSWKDTPWGREIEAFGKQEWPNGQPSHRDFAWKITDGDSTEVNKKGKKPCDREGYPGHWVLQLSSFNPPQIVNENGQRALPREEVEIEPGDYVQAFIDLRSNKATDSPGLYVEAKVIAFQGKGTRIILAEQIDTAAIGFGQGPKPEAAGAVPEGRVGTSAPPPPEDAPPPRTEFSAGAGAAPPPPPPEEVDRRTDKARAQYPGVTTEQMLAWPGWGEAKLVAHGYLTA